MPFFSKKNYSTIKVRKREMPDGLWIKCPGCGEIVFKQELEANLQMCPKCGYHFQMSRRERIAMLLEPESFVPWDEAMISVDTLGFTGTASYTSKLAENRKKTGYRDAISIGKGRIADMDIGLGVMDFSFLGASMGSVVGEKVTRLIERCTAEGLPVVLVCASGGARMYEGMFSLMQMAKTSGALARHAEAGLAYIPVLTHPTMAGVMASFATLGDVIVAEPGALIGFAGPRVIKETTQQDLPDGFQTSEFLLKHGLLDVVAPRKELKETLVNLLRFMRKQAA
ncbi:MAG TPA: acetyl-CoA carboxylase, carboxyltransferase subunit beta [Kiritimatiellia bacterium]|nr:acetyl-CoA carboxylase, carboxyltransferase subunit beta [Kiritimatiellia bacterium]HMO98978.1 acetyl-CoA carboxylase, carboxyltransferase subunit beta [Kiritimatiellia bacterium]HMP96689.1 acetyl-CoA carboxylase, carboxyltransferase subunit beta [Kiritimatiellia bacterium]